MQRYTLDIGRLTKSESGQLVFYGQAIEIIKEQQRKIEQLEYKVKSQQAIERKCKNDRRIDGSCKTGI